MTAYINKIKERIKNHNFHLNFWVNLIFATMTLLAFNMNAGTSTIPEKAEALPLFEHELGRLFLHIVYALKPLNLLFVVLLIPLVYFYCKRASVKCEKGNRILYAIFSVFFGLVAVFCESYHRTNTWDLVLGSKSAMAIACIRMLGFAFLAYTCLVHIMYYVEGYFDKISATQKCKYLSILKYALIILLCWLPYIILLFPGCIAPDGQDQLAQVLGNKELCWSQRMVVLLDEDVILNNHHPILYALFLTPFAKLAQNVDSPAMVFEALCIVQAIILATAFAYMIVAMKKRCSDKRLIYGALLFCCLNPVFPTYAMTIVKDSMFCALLVFTFVQMYELLDEEKPSILRLLVFAVTLLLFLLIRNNSIYIMLVVFVFAIFYLRKKKFKFRKLAAMLVPILIFQIGIVNIIYPALKITPGSTKEMLSVPFVQTARYVRDYPEEISAEDEEILLNIFKNKESLEDIAKSYNPRLSDPIKDSYNKYATTEDLKDYFSVWSKGLVEHPTTYVEAFLNLHYGWFSFEGIEGITYIGTGGLRLNELFEGYDNAGGNAAARQTMEQFWTFLNNMPLTSLFIEMATYSWIYIFLFLYAIRKKNWKAFVVILIPILNYCIHLLGPIASTRYSIAMMCIMPFAIFMTFRKEKKEEQKHEQNCSVNSLLQ